MTKSFFVVILELGTLRENCSEVKGRCVLDILSVVDVAVSPNNNPIVFFLLNVA